MPQPPSMPPKRRIREPAPADMATPPKPHSNTVGSEHTDFSESKDEVAPLTEEEKKARLEELRLRLQEKKASQADLDRDEAKRNEV